MAFPTLLATNVKMKPLKPRELIVLLLLLGVIVFGSVIVKQNHESKTITCEAGLWGKKIYGYSEAEIKSNILKAYSTKDTLSYECKWETWKDKCLCRFKNETQWTPAKEFVIQEPEKKPIKFTLNLSLSKELSLKY